MSYGQLRHCLWKLLGAFSSTGDQRGHPVHCPTLKKGENYPKWIFFPSSPIWKFLMDFPVLTEYKIWCLACLTPSPSAQAGSHKAVLVLLGGKGGRNLLTVLPKCKMQVTFLSFH